jgi:hypothetical protein
LVEERALDQLRSILLSKDKEELYRINDELRMEVLNEIHVLKNELDDPVLFSKKINGARSEIVDILGPVMGRMIKKYIQVEIEKLNQKMQQGTKNLTSVAYWKQLFSKKESLIDNAEFQEIMLINKDSGLLIAKYAKKEISDPDIVAGMFTAIKSFMETVLDSKESEVGLIDYGDFKILLQDYGTFYFSVVFTGFNDANFKSKVLEGIRQFAEEHALGQKNTFLSNKEIEGIELNLKVHFQKLCKKL